MRIVIDLQGAQTSSHLRGIGRYSLSLTKAIVRNRGSHEIIIVLSGLFPETIESIRGEFYGLVRQENIRVWEGVGPVKALNKENKWRYKTSELIRGAFILSLMPDFVLLSTLFEGYADDFVGSSDELNHNIPTAVIFYDLIPFLNKKEYLADAAVSAWYKTKLDECKRAHLLLSISESSRQEALGNLGFKSECVVNISSASDQQFKPIQISAAEKEKLKSKFGILKDYLLYSGATDPRKNHIRLIEAYSNLKQVTRSRHQLIIVGGMPDEHRNSILKYAAKCKLEKGELVLTGRVSDDEIVALYNLCKAFIIPSWHEGFGLPALEAMKCGRAVIASNTTSLPEVVGYADALFDPYDVHDMKKKIEQVLTDDVFRNTLEDHGLEMSKLFSWDLTAKRSIAAIESHYKKLVVMRRNDNLSHDYYKIQTSLTDSIAKLTDHFSDDDLLSAAQAIAQNDQGQKNNQLLVDISVLSECDPKTGVQRVTRSILYELLNNPPNGWLVEPVYVRGSNQYHYARRFTQQILGLEHKDTTDEVVEYSLNDIYLGLDLVSDIALIHRDFYKHLRNHGVKVFFVVYDLLPIYFPHYWEDRVSAVHAQWLGVVTESDGAICISRSVAKEVHTWVEEQGVESKRPFKIGWFHLGADIESSIPSIGMPDDANDFLREIQDCPSFLMVGTIEPRKGYSQTLKAFEHLWTDGVDINLIIIGKKGWKVDALTKKLSQHPELGKHLYWLEGISDEYLEKIYASSTCLIAASEGEGFGLPLIEAAQHGLPIIARDIPVFREVAGNGAFYFKGSEPKTLSKSIKEWLILKVDNNVPQSTGIPWITWKQSTKQLIDCIIPSVSV